MLQRSMGFQPIDKVFQTLLMGFAVGKNDASRAIFQSYEVMRYTNPP